MHDLPRTSERGPRVQVLVFAVYRHRDQRRKDAEVSPCINHPIALANVLIHEGNMEDPVVICAAPLHDTIEGPETTEGELRVAF